MNNFTERKNQRKLAEVRNKLDDLLPWHVADQIAKTEITADA